jgi:hypothetical protein
MEDDLSVQCIVLVVAHEKKISAITSGLKLFMLKVKKDWQKSLIYHPRPNVFL